MKEKLVFLLALATAARISEMYIIMLSQLKKALAVPRAGSVWGMTLTLSWISFVALDAWFQSLERVSPCRSQSGQSAFSEILG